jgi:hypothetical protein
LAAFSRNLELKKKNMEGEFINIKKIDENGKLYSQKQLKIRAI